VKTIDMHASTHSQHIARQRSLPRMAALSIALASAWGSAHAADNASSVAGVKPASLMQPASVLNADPYFKSDGNNDGSDDAVASGTNAMAAGAYAYVAGDYSTGIGAYNQVVGSYGTALGSFSAVYGTGGVALGSLAVVNADYGTAIGYGSFAGGLSSIAIGGYGQIPDPTGSTLIDALASAASGSASIAIGTGANASEDFNVALGAGASATGPQSVAIGLQAQAAGPTAVSIGGFSTAAGLYSTAVGYQAYAPDERTSAFGVAAQAYGQSSTALGQVATAGYAGIDWGFATAVGSNAQAGANFATALGANSYALGDYAVALGTGSYANSAYSIASGAYAQANGAGSIALGTGAQAGGIRPPTPGDGDGGGDGGDPCWICSVNGGVHSMGGIENADYAVALGNYAQAFGTGGLALGSYAQVTGNNSVALGAGSVADRDNVVSVGASAPWMNYNDGSNHEAFDRQIINVAAGTEDTDAVNVGQLNQAIAGVVGSGGNGSDLAAALGGGASFANGSWSGPNYRIQNGAYSNVGDALQALDQSLTGAWQNISQLQQTVDGWNSGGGAPMGSGNGLAVGDKSIATDGRDTAIGTNATVGADGSTAVGSNATISASATNAVAVGADSNVTTASGTALGQAASVTAQNSVALGANSVANEANTVSVGSASNQRRVTNVAAGVNPTDAANVSQVDEALQTAKTYADAGDQRTLSAANAYTDSKLGNSVSRSDFDSFRNQVNDQFSNVNRRLDRVGAMGTAMAQMTASTSGLAGENRLGAGVGTYGGQSAISVGYQRGFAGNRASVSVGAATSGSETTVGIGGGFSW